MDKRIKSFAIATLRRGSYRWPGRWMAEKRSKVGRNQYVCECCGQILPKRLTNMDHIFPIVDPYQGFVGFDSYIERLYCNADGYQRLCLECHDRKSAQENLIRKETKQNKA